MINLNIQKFIIKVKAGENIEALAYRYLLVILGLTCLVEVINIFYQYKEIPNLYFEKGWNAAEAISFFLLFVSSYNKNRMYNQKDFFNRFICLYFLTGIRLFFLVIPVTSFWVFINFFFLKGRVFYGVEIYEWLIQVSFFSLSIFHIFWMRRLFSRL